MRIPSARTGRRLLPALPAVDSGSIGPTFSPLNPAMSFLVYVLLVLIAAVALFMLLDLLEAIAHLGIVLMAIAALASYDSTSHYFKARGVYGDLKVSQYVEAVLGKHAFDVTEEIRRQYANAKAQGHLPDTSGIERDIRDAVREIRR